MNAARADNGQLAAGLLVQVANDLGGALAQRRPLRPPAPSAATWAAAVRSPAAADGGVGGHQAA